MGSCTNSFAAEERDVMVVCWTVVVITYGTITVMGPMEGQRTEVAKCWVSIA